MVIKLTVCFHVKFLNLYQTAGNRICQIFLIFIVPSGSFVYDVDLGGHEWTPTKEELMVISAKLHRLAEEEIPFERLLVDVNLAKEMFHDNEHKKKQIPNIAKNSPSGNYKTF